MPFLRNVPGLEAVYRDYAPKGVRFRMIYKSIVHPGTNGYTEPYTLAERLRHVKVARQRLRTTVPWICDSMDNAIKAALKAAPNAEFVVDAEGKVLRKRFWHDPAELRAFLAEQVGAVERPTQVADLDMQLVFPERKAPRGVVKPLAMTERMRGLRVAPVLPKAAAAGGDDEAADSAPPFFAKLVAEGCRQLLRTGEGRLYLGFYLDPLYEVHWNNPAGGLSFRIERPGDAEFEDVTGQTPNYEHDIDIDPREFFADIAAAKGAELRLTVRYTVCDDAETFCMPVEQSYTITLERDPHAGSRAGDWMTELCGDPMQFDKNEDGRVTRAELPAKRAQLIINHVDRNHDDVITAAEAKLFHDMIRIKPGETGR
ncbi:MAG: protein-disulfide reductase DsbD N-terminal domain-containing protein [bacterium]|nr:protein-disulfide reductase DsbD N-terminal domain-containing protein [bacterium]